MNSGVLAILCLLGLSAGLLFVLAGLVMGRKALRDRREARSRARRARYRDVLEAGGGPALEAAFARVRSRGAELDLLVALDGL